MVNDTKTMDENPFKTQMTQEFSQMVDDLYRADIESFDGDRTSYMEKANNAQKVIGDFQKVVGLLDADVNEYKDKSPAELKKLVLRSQFMGKDGMKREDYLAFLNDPSKMGMRIQNGELIITNNGKDLFNGTRYLNSKKDGYSLVEYGNDYTKEIDSAAKDAMQGVGDLAIIRQYEKLSEDGKKLTGFTDVDYRKAVKAYRNNLINSDKIDALINESTFQRYTTNRDVYNADKHFEETKTAIIDDLVRKQFPTAYRTKQVTSKLVTPKKGKEKDSEETNFNNWINENITKKTKQTRYHDSPKEVTDMFDIPLPEKRKKVLEKIRSFNKVDLVYGSDDRVSDAKGNEANPNKLYQLVKVPGAGSFNAFEVTVSDEDVLNNEALNKLLVDYNLKFNKSSVL